MSLSFQHPFGNGPGIPVGETILFTLHYADDQIVSAEDFKDVLHMMQ